MSEPGPCKVWMLWAGKKGTRSYCGAQAKKVDVFQVSLHRFRVKSFRL